MSRGLGDVYKRQEGWEAIRQRIWSGFTEIAQGLEAAGGGNALVVSHGMTIGTLAYLIDGSRPHGLQNGSVTVIAYEDGQFTIECIGDMSYREKGAVLLEELGE